MKHIARFALAALALFAAPALAQSPPTTFPPNTVFGRLGTVPGPGQAIPMSTLAANIFGAGPITSTLTLTPTTGPALIANGNIQITGGTLAINPTASTYSIAISANTSTPTTSFAGPFAHNVLNCTEQGAITGAGTDAFGLFNTNSTCLRVNMTVNGASWSGQAKTALMGNASITGTVPASGTDVIGNSGTFFTNVDASVTGAGGYGQNSFSHLGASGKINHLVSHEADVQIDNSTAGAARVRRAYAAVNSGAFAASVVDCAYCMASTVAGGAFPHGLFLFTDGSYNQSPITSTGDLIGTNIANLPLGSVINLPTAVFSGNIFSFLNFTTASTGLTTISRNGIGSTSTDAFVLQNTTAAANNAQQFSPRIHMIGQGWQTGTSASQTVDVIMEAQPSQSGLSIAQGGLFISVQQNGGGYQQLMRVFYNANGNTQTSLVSPSAKNANITWVDGANAVWYMSNTGGSGDLMQFLNSDANGNAAIMSWNQTGAVTIGLGSVIMGTATKTLVLKQGANGAVGTFVCTSGGSITVTNSNVAVTDAIIISLNTAGGTITTAPALNAITAATSFVAKCATNDTATYNYAIIKNAA